MSDVQSAYGELAAARALEQLPSFSPGPLTPLLVEGTGQPLQPALRGALGGGVDGVVGQLAYSATRHSASTSPSPRSRPRLSSRRASSASAAAAAPATTSSTASRRAVLVAAGLYWYARRQEKKAAHDDWIFRQGLRGTATVLAAGSSATVNEMPLMSLRLELEVPGHGAREVKRREIMPVFAASRMEPGLVLPVYVNPQDRGEFVLVW